VIRAQTKRIVRAIYVFRCGYCGVSEVQVGAELTYDHFCPQSQNGTDDAANIVYACHACNEFKGDYWSETEGILQALTSLGQIYIDQLQLNRPPLIENRMERQRVLRTEHHLAEMSLTLQNILVEVKKQESLKRRKSS
jgi:HNH endonuclease